MPVFLGIAAASEDGDWVTRMRDVVRSTLVAANLPPYDEPDKLPPASDRDLDIKSFRMLARTIIRARGKQAGPFQDIATSVGQIIVPGEFTDRVEADGLDRTKIARCLWSTAAFRASLKLAALTLGLPLSNNDVPAAIVKKVDAGQKLSKNDPASDEPDEHGFSMLEHYRPGWLTAWELSRIAHEHNCALVITA